MASKASITIEKLTALGVGRLAELVAAQAEADRSFRKQVVLAIAADRGLPELLREIDKRIRAIGISRSFVDWQRAQSLTDELNGLRRSIVDDVGKSDPIAAADRMRTFLKLSGGVLRRAGESSGRIADNFRQAVEDIGVLWLAVPDRDANALAELTIDLHVADEYGVCEGAIAAMARALGPQGLAALRALFERRLASQPPVDVERWEAFSARCRLRSGLAEIADALGDVDGFIAAMAQPGDRYVNVLAIAGRLAKADRLAEALAWLEREDVRRSGDAVAALGLRTEVLERLGRRDEAQSLRWAEFERSLSLSLLRDYLKRLPDFEDVEAETRAVAIALEHRNVADALMLLVQMPNLAKADELVRTRLAEFDGRLYEIMLPAAEMLAERHPVAATLLLRRMVDSILERASSKQYLYAARDVRSCEDLAARLPADGSIESHAEFIARLRRAHGRKYGFWPLLEELGWSDPAAG